MFGYVLLPVKTRPIMYTNGIHLIKSGDSLNGKQEKCRKVLFLHMELCLISGSSFLDIIFDLCEMISVYTNC